MGEIDNISSAGNRHLHHMSDRISAAYESILDNKVLIAAIGFAVILLLIYMRMGLIHYQGLFEPDGFFYYAIVKATLANHLSEPQYLGVSGFAPNHNFIGEAPGLPYITVIFYLLLKWSGTSALVVMRLLPVFFAALEAIVAYFMVKDLSKNRMLGIFAMFFIAVSSANIARTAALVHRGDTFITLILMVAVYLLVKGIEHKNWQIKAALCSFGAFVLSLGILIWNGFSYIVVVYMLAIMLIAIYAFIKGDMELSKSSLIATLTLFLTFILESIYGSLHGTRLGLPFEGITFVAFYVPLFIGIAFAYYALRKMRHINLLSSKKGRAIISAAIFVIGIIFITVAFHQYVAQMLTASGTTSPTSTKATANNIGSAVGSTTQELQKPSFDFLFASFGLQLILAPIGIVAFLLFGEGLNMREKKMKLTINPAFLTMLGYFAVTAFLQYNAIRYNSLLSIPMAIFAAYGLYAIVELGMKAHLKSMESIAITSIVSYAFIAYSIYMLYAIAHAGFAIVAASSNPLNGVNGLTLFTAHGYILESIPVIIVLAGAVLYTFFALFKRYMKVSYMVLALLLAILIYSTFKTQTESFAFTQADGINQQFLNAMVWMRNNTAQNATVLALWPDGSVVEAWANRTSYMDSVGGENATRIYHFARFLENTTPDSSYLYSIGKPDYLVARDYWLSELQGLAEEGLPKNISNYSYGILQPVGITNNSTSHIYTFESQGYKAEIVANYGAANTIPTSYNAYIGGVQSTQLERISHVILYNDSNSAYAIYNDSNQSAPFSIMLLYSGRYITGALWFPNALYNSNLFKFVFLCNQLQCAYNEQNSTTTLHLVFANNDTRIYSITYK